MQRILVLGAGFAGLWGAVGAARKLDELGIGADAVEVALIDRTASHSIRVRNYERDLSETLVPLAGVLDPIGVKHIVGEVTGLDLERRMVNYIAEGAERSLGYDRLIFALGSRLARPGIPGLAEHGFDIDTYADAMKLNAHLAALPSRAPSPELYTVLVIGAGLTGIEAATEMPGKLRSVCGDMAQAARVIIADREPWIGSDMGESARAVIDEAMRALGIETRPGVAVAEVDARGVELAGGERIGAATVVWCAGMQADALTQRFPVHRDRFGRLPVDARLKIAGRSEFAAGDAAVFPIDGVHPCVMSCQHARPMGRFAGHNAVCDLLGLPMLELRIDWYATVLDLGPWGAVYTEGRDRHVVATGAVAKHTKETINRERIYPPRSGIRRDILDAAAPTVQTAPARR